MTDARPRFKGNQFLGCKGIGPEPENLYNVTVSAFIYQQADEDPGFTRLDGLRRVLAAARADRDASIEDQHSAAFVALDAIVSLSQMVSSDKIRDHHDIYLLVSALLSATTDIARNLRRWSDVCQLRPDLYVRPDIPGLETSSPSYWRRFFPEGMTRGGQLASAPEDLAHGRRHATPQEAEAFAVDEAGYFRELADDLDAVGQRAQLLMWSSAWFSPSTEPLRVVTALYRAFDVEGRLLYIGITSDWPTRRLQHMKSSSWYDFAVEFRIEECGDRPRAEQLEMYAIKSERPLFNHQHNDTPEARAALVAYLVEKSRTDLLVPSVSRG